MALPYQNAMAGTSTRRNTARDYTIACICPMGVEAAPVIAMLDELHDPISFPRSQNVYTLGKIGGHNVVVVIMPEIGNNAAARVATRLGIDFPAIRFSLLVGVGGGVPGKADVRLGDVVVSQPTETSGGVIQYDMGKKLQGGGFQRTGVLHKPPAVLSASVRTLDAENRRKGDQLSQYMSEMMKRNPAMHAEYSLPRTGPDRLFLSSHIHQSGPSCNECDLRQTVQRLPRLGGGPHIHYGIIGSANIVVKDAQIRDDLGKNMNILCVEMEAAGLMDDFPCLVIRGICDYADSHKNKSWQPYAASTAAAYMKSLLAVVPDSQGPGVMDTINGDISPWLAFHLGLRLGQAPVIESNLFVGRQSELQRMQEILQPQDQLREQHRLVLGGLGGVGKTQLALAYAKRYHNFYSSVFWLNATTEAELRQSFQEMAQQVLDMEKYSTLDDQQVQQHVSRWLLDVRNTRWLLILDNYDEPETFNIWKYCPYCANGDIIITSRLPDQIAGHQLSVQPLPDIGDGVQILETRSWRHDIRIDSYVYRLAKRMQGFPLALATAGAFLRYSTWTCERYLKEYEARWHVNPQQPLKLREYRDRTLYTTWDLSYRQLEEKNADAAKLLKQFAYFDNGYIWYDLLRIGLTSDTPDWLRRIVECEDTFNNIVRSLTEYCFVEASWSTQSWSIHNCVHDWVVAQLNQTSDPHGYWFTFNCIAKLVMQQEWDELEVVKHAPLVPHAMRLVENRFGEVGGRLSETLIEPAAWIAELLKVQIQYASAEKMYQWILSEQERAVGPDHTSTLRTVHHLGNLYGRQDRLEEAEQMYLRALAGTEKALGPDHTSTLDTVGNLGLLYEGQDRLEEAERMYLRALAGAEKALGPDHTSTLRTVGNLGNLYERQDRLEEAEQMYIRALAGKEKALGPDHTSTLRTVHHLGNLYGRQDRLEEAERMCLRALAGKEKALGPDHTSTLRTVHHLGLLYGRQDRLEEAERMYLRALAGAEKALGPDHTSTLRTVGNLGNLYYKQDRLEEAERMYLRALAGAEKALGPDHTSTLDTVGNLGNLYYKQDRLEEAERMYLRALAGTEKALGPDHTSTLSTVHHLGNLYGRQDRLEEAEQMYIRALAGAEKALGPDHTSTLSTVSNLGNLYYKQDRLDAAEELTGRVLSVKTRIFGPDHPTTLTAAKTLDRIRTKRASADKQALRRNSDQVVHQKLWGNKKSRGLRRLLPWSKKPDPGRR